MFPTAGQMFKKPSLANQRAVDLRNDKQDFWYGAYDGFLDNMIKAAKLSMKQAEFLEGLSNGQKKIIHLGPYSLERVVNGCLSTMSELDKTDRNMLKTIASREPMFVYRANLGRIMYLAKSLAVVPDTWIDL